MGTRNLTLVLKNNEYKVAQYCQWDGYLDGQGKQVIAFVIGYLQDPEKLKQFTENVLSAKEISDEDLKALWVECGASPDSNMVSLDVSNKFSKKHPQLHRDFGANILEYIYSTPNAKIRKETEFAKDSLFCEFAYLINLDNNTVEFYKGFNKAPLTSEDRFFNLQDLEEEYMPVKMFASIPFSEFNEESMSKLKNLLGEDDDA